MSNNSTYRTLNPNRFSVEDYKKKYPKKTQEIEELALLQLGIQQYDLNILWPTGPLTKEFFTELQERIHFLIQWTIRQYELSSKLPKKKQEKILQFSMNNPDDIALMIDQGKIYYKNFWIRWCWWSRLSKKHKKKLMKLREWKDLSWREIATERRTSILCSKMIQTNDFTMGEKNGSFGPIGMLTRTLLPPKTTPVQMTRFLEVLQTPVTIELYTLIMEDNPSYRNHIQRPVDSVTWDMAISFCQRINKILGLERVYRGSGDNIKCDFDANGWRLPTEAEWEFCARGAHQWHDFSGDAQASEAGWYRWNSGPFGFPMWQKSHPVCQKKQNGFGLYDMSGNVQEWCWDRYSGSLTKNVKNPTGPLYGTYSSKRILRGGSFWSFRFQTTVYHRGRDYTYTKSPDIGFRIVRTKGAS